MDLDIVRLADTVETTDTLLQQIRVKRQVEHHQVAGELEVASFGADLGAQQHLRRCAQVKSFRLGTYGEGESGVTIAELK